MLVPLIILTLLQFSLCSKILVISGYQNTNYKDDVVKTEVIDLEDQTNACQNLNLIFFLAPNFQILLIIFSKKIRSPGVTG